MTLTQFMAVVDSVMGVVGDGIEIFLEPPLVWFVALSLGVVGINVAKRLIPRKRG